MVLDVTFGEALALSLGGRPDPGSGSSAVALETFRITAAPAGTEGSGLAISFDSEGENAEEPAEAPEEEDKQAPGLEPDEAEVEKQGPDEWAEDKDLGEINDSWW